MGHRQRKAQCRDQECDNMLPGTCYHKPQKWLISKEKKMVCRLEDLN
jgi:hypothetical protein